MSAKEIKYFEKVSGGIEDGKYLNINTGRAVVGKGKTAQGKAKDETLRVMADTQGELDDFVQKYNLWSTTLAPKGAEKPKKSTKGKGKKALTPPASPPGSPKPPKMPSPAKMVIKKGKGKAPVVPIVPSVPGFDTKKCGKEFKPSERYSLTELKEKAKTAKIPGYSKLNMDELCEKLGLSKKATEPIAEPVVNKVPSPPQLRQPAPLLKRKTSTPPASPKRKTLTPPASPKRKTPKPADEMDELVTVLTQIRKPAIGDATTKKTIRAAVEGPIPAPPAEIQELSQKLASQKTRNQIRQCLGLPV